MCQNLSGAWAAVPALTAMYCSHRYLFSAAALTVPSIDPLSALIRDGHSWHELGWPHDRAVYEAIKGWEPMRFARSLEVTEPGPSGSLCEKGDGDTVGDMKLDQSCPIDQGRGSRNKARIGAFEAGATQDAPMLPSLSLLLRSGVFDDKVGYWEAAAFVAGLRRTGTLGGARVVEEAMLRVKAGGHDCFDAPEDDAELCAWIHCGAMNE